MIPISEQKWLRIENSTIPELINLEGCVAISPETHYINPSVSSDFLYSIYFLYVGETHNEIKFNSKEFRDKTFNAIIKLVQPYTIGGLEI